MRLSALAGKEIINLQDGSRMGSVDDCELAVHADTGEINALLLPSRSRFSQFLGNKPISVIPWTHIRKIGNDVIIVDHSFFYQAEKDA